MSVTEAVWQEKLTNLNEIWRKSDILTGLPDFKIWYEEEVSPSVWLFDFWRKR